MKDRLMMVFATLFMVLAATAAHAQRGAPQSTDRIIPLGEEIAKFDRETDTFLVGPDKGRFSALIFTSERAAVQVAQVKVTFANGQSETIPVGQIAKADEGRIVVDLPGRGRRLSAIEATYQTVAGAAKRAIVTLSGRRFIAPPLRFETIASGRFSLRDGEISVPIGRRSGAFDAIRIATTRREVFVHEVVAVFANGREKVFPISDWLSAGSATPPLLFGGRARFVDRVILKIRPRPGHRRADVEVLAHRPQPPGGVRARLGELPPVDRRGEPRGFDRVTRVRLSDRFDPSPIQIGRKAGLIRGLVIRAVNNAAQIRTIAITYGNGQTDEIDVAERMREDEVSRIIDFGRPRFVREINIIARSQRRGPNASLELYADLAGDPGPQPQRRSASRQKDYQLKWALLATRTPPMFQPQTEVIRIGRQAGALRALRLKVKRHDVRVLELQVLFANGKTQDIPISGTIADGTTTKEVELTSGFVQDVKIRFQSSPNLKGEGQIEIWGLK
jgi:hypothetical protein